MKIVIHKYRDLANQFTTYLVRMHFGNTVHHFAEFSTEEQAEKCAKKLLKDCENPTIARWGGGQ